ncbi:MAG: lytic murein transglycosylase [Thermodesulfobacteriota bacterium]|nr:lytic murein transglycosylase [Thermodesulfobacteriota bacterium]
MKKYLAGMTFFLFFAFFTVPIIYAETPADYSLWLNNFKVEAQNSGIKPETVNRALNGVKPLDWIIKLDRAQPEFTKTLDEYLAGAVNSKRIKQGQRLLNENSDTLTRITKKYPVQPRFLMALWGIETSFGLHTGKVPVVDALVTLAYDGRRGQYFRSELLNALKILDQGHISFNQMKGSWAGAMGQVQFMPSTFLNFAVDGNGDGRIDLWNTRIDYLSSAASYLLKSGWDDNYTWGREVSFPKNLNGDYFGMKQQRLLSEWQTLGVRTVEGKDLPKVKIAASLIQPDGPKGRAFLVYNNYRVLMKWNRAHRFAVAVGSLADRIGAR